MPSVPDSGSLLKCLQVTTLDVLVCSVFGGRMLSAGQGFL